METNWKSEIIKLINIKQTLKKVDIDNRLPYHFPEIGAREEQIIKVENILGFGIEPLYRSFLKVADGWKGFYQDLDLFGTEELAGGSGMRKAMQILNSLAPRMIEKTDFSKEELLPLGVSVHARELLVITKPESHSPGVILWFVSKEILLFFNFEDFFNSVIKYHQYLVKSGIPGHTPTQGGTEFTREIVIKGSRGGNSSTLWKKNSGFQRKKC